MNLPSVIDRMPFSTYKAAIWHTDLNEAKALRGQGRSLTSECILESLRREISSELFPPPLRQPDCPSGNNIRETGMPRNKPDTTPFAELHMRFGNARKVNQIGDIVVGGIYCIRSKKSGASPPYVMRVLSLPYAEEGKNWMVSVDMLFDDGSIERNKKVSLADCGIVPYVNTNLSNFDVVLLQITRRQ